MKKLSILLYLAINLLFVLKYSMRVFPLYACLICCVVFIVLIILLIRIPIIQKFHFSILHFSIFLSVSLLILSILQSLIDPYSLQVDRWSAIYGFLDNMLNGIYPYAAQTHLGGYGSPFPIWQFFHLPFYLLGNVGLSFIVGVLFFIHSIYLISNVKIVTQAFILLLISPAFIYEVMVRSDMMTNFLVSAAIVMYLYYYNIKFQKHYVLLAIIGGMLLSTRLSAVIPLAIFFLNSFIKAGFRLQIISVLSACIVFFITFLPFLLWNSQMMLFFEYNPFVLQTRQGHLADILLLIPIGIGAGMMWKGNFMRYSFSTAICLIMLVAITFFHNMLIDNSWLKIFDSLYDITYFCMAIPFLIITIALSSIDNLQVYNNETMQKYG